MIGIADKKTTLKNLLVKQIQEGQLISGDQLPSERELTLLHQVSRTTVRLALDEMHQANILTRRRGAGTYVSEQALMQINESVTPKVMTAAFVMPLSRFYNPVLRGMFEAFCGALDQRVEGRVFYHNFLKPDQYKQEGVVVVVVDDLYDPDQIQNLRNQYKHVILINRQVSQLPYVTIDSYQGGRIQAEHILSRGHRKIGCLHFGTRDPENEMARRYQGIQDVMKEHGLPLHSLMIVESDRPYYQAVDRLLKQAFDITAILCLSDLTVAHVYETLADKGINIPDDISVIGFDDQTCVSALCPPLTTVRHPVTEIGTCLAQAVNGLLESDEPLKLAQTITPMLIERQSVKDIR